MYENENLNELENDVNGNAEGTDNKNFGYILGRAFGSVIVACLSSLAIATTVRLIMWIL